MASEFQRRKLARVFEAMDVDGDGFLERGDFEALAARWTESPGGQTGSADEGRFAGAMMSWWESLLAASDQDRDDKVTLEEALAVVDRLGTRLGAVTTIAAALFEALDEDTDGWISAEEYRRLIQTLTGQATDTDEVFARLDLDGDGQLSNGEFIELWTQFWVGDDPDEPGNWVFGEVDPAAPPSA